MNLASGGPRIFLAVIPVGGLIVKGWSQIEYVCKLLDFYSHMPEWEITSYYRPAEAHPLADTCVLAFSCMHCKLAVNAISHNATTTVYVH